MAATIAVDWRLPPVPVDVPDPVYDQLVAELARRWHPLVAAIEAAKVLNVAARQAARRAASR